MLIVDTSVIVAAADQADPHHTACAQALTNEPEELGTTAMVIAEAAYLLDRQLGPDAEALLYESILDEELLIQPLEKADWRRVRDLVLQYADLHLGGTDASLIALAERAGTHRVATLNHRHFRVVRPAHVRAFTLVPETP